MPINRRLLELLEFLHPPREEAQPGTGVLNLHRIDPLMLLNILEALKRYDSALANALSDRLGLSQERLLELASSGELLGPGPLVDVLDALDHHPRYDEIVNLAGRNSFSMQGARDGAIRRAPLPVMARLIAQRMLPFLGESSLDIDIKGRVLMLRITNSIFAHDRFSLNSLCGFYVGYLQQFGQDTGLRRLDARESRCACQDEDERCCLIHVST